jgi:hypothetical protein
VSTKDIRTSVHHTTCDVCGRTLLRGEHPDAYVVGGERRWVCDLCTSRALHEGWVREGTVPSFDRDASARDRRRSPLGWLRSRRIQDGHQNAVSPAARPSADPAMPPPVPAVREPRHVRAVPASVEQKIASAAEAFNETEHARTIAGIARSLGPPAVSVRPSDASPSSVSLTASWELCWYRYEIDLSDGPSGVRLAAQGAELSELSDEEREPNASADEDGLLTLHT